MRDFEKIIGKINDTSFYRCEEVMCGDTFYYLFAGWKDKGSTTLFLKAIKKLVRHLYAEAYIIKKVGMGDTLFLYSGSGGERPDFRRHFQGVVDISKNHVLMELGNTRQLTLGRIKYAKEVCAWMKNLRGSGLSLSMKVFVVAYLLDAYIAYDVLRKKVKFETLKSLVVLCDVHMIDSFFVQKFNRLGKTTITLQHGNVSSLYNTWALIGSRSQYFLASNQFSILEGEHIGYQNKMLLVGFYANVDESFREKAFISVVKIIGAFVDGTFDEDNYRMIDTLLAYCEMSRCTLKVKFHPTNQIEKYEERYSGKDIVFVDKTMSVLEFCDGIDVAVIRNSATLIETLQYGVPAYIINDADQAANVYKNVNILKFKTAEDLYALINARTVADLYDDLRIGRRLFCCEGNIANNYREAFDTLGVS